MPSSLYVHVPFCAQKCEYCAFYSTAANGELVDRYVRALISEIHLRAADLILPLETVFFGGGTPSLLNLRQWSAILKAFERHGLLGAREWTVECNPATVSADKARLLRDHGVNRISMGVQSLDDALLDRLGRVHSRDMVFRSYDLLRKAGFDNINIDLMFAIPGQTLDVWRETLKEAVALKTEHLSSYEVIYEEDTPLYARLQAGEFDVDEALASDMFETLVETAASAGFHQYEIANFARGPLETDLPKFACRHNATYWRGRPYAALGPSAHGFERGIRYRNVANTQRYCESLEAGELPREGTETLPPRARAGEIAAFGLRMNAGWPWDEFTGATGYDLRVEWPEVLENLRTRGWGVVEPDRFRLTPQGLRFADAAGSEFLVSA